MSFRVAAASVFVLCASASGITAAQTPAPTPSAPPSAPASAHPSAAPNAVPNGAQAPASTPPSATLPAPNVDSDHATPVYPPGYSPSDPPASYGTYPPAYGGDPHAAEPATRAGEFEHEGFFLRLQLGVGAGGTSYSERIDATGNRSTVKTRGVTGAFEFAIGGRVFQNLIIHGTLIAAGNAANKLVDGVEDNTYYDIGTRTLLLGGGATYYVMPMNLFVTFSMGAAYFEEDRIDDRSGQKVHLNFSSGAGVGGALTIGKEWWVGRRGEWAIGGALTGTFQSTPIEISGEDTWAKSHHVSLNFTATYN